MLVVPVNVKDEPSVNMAEEVYANLLKAGIETAIDDRKERPGVKFKDADLIGYPIRIVIGPKTLTEKQIEVKIRKTGEVLSLPLDGDYVQSVKEVLLKL